MPIARNHSTIQKIVQKGKKKVGAICQEIELQIIFRKRDIFFFQSNSSTWQVQEFVHGVCAALSLPFDGRRFITLFVPHNGGRWREERPPSPSTLLSQLRHELKERTKAAGGRWYRQHAAKAPKAVSRNDGKVHVSYRANKRTTDERTERRDQRTDGRDSTVDYRRLDCGTKAGRNNDGLSVLARLMTVMECFFFKRTGKM